MFTRGSGDPLLSAFSPLEPKARLTFLIDQPPRVGVPQGYPRGPLRIYQESSSQSFEVLLHFISQNLALKTRCVCTFSARLFLEHGVCSIREGTLLKQPEFTP